MNGRKYPFSLFIIGFVSNIIFRFFWLFIPSIVLLFIGISSPIYRYIGLTLLLLDVIFSFIEQMIIRNTFLKDSDNPQFRKFQDAMSKDGDWRQNARDFFEGRINDTNCVNPDEDNTDENDENDNQDNM